jgi:heptosyltransferase III
LIFRIIKLFKDLETFPKNIIISRTDSIGDVILTLPVAAVLKKHFPEIKIGFLGKAYTRPVIEACKYVDTFIDINVFLKDDTIQINGEKPVAILHVFPVAAIAMRALQLHIPLRIGTTNRFYHWLTCNKLVKLSRKHSLLHEAQLNLKLLKVFGIINNFSLQEIGKLFGLEKLKPLPEKFKNLISKDKYNLILHPKSLGSAREWGLSNFIMLIRLLGTSRYRIFISGTEKEREALQPVFNEVGDAVTDISGLMNLDEFISFISHCDGLVANSTGPLHIAAALGKDALGIYPPMRPIHPGRWAPLGPNARTFVLDKFCNDCKNNNKLCQCIMQVEPQWIKISLEK